MVCFKTVFHNFNWSIPENFVPNNLQKHFFTGFPLNGQSEQFRRIQKNTCRGVSIPATFVNVSTTGNFLGILKKIYSLFQPGAAFRKETSYLIFRVNQMIDSCTKCNTWLKWLNTAVFHKHLQKTASITLILVPPFNAIVSKNIL